MGLHSDTAGSGVLRDAVSLPASPRPPSSVMFTFTFLGREMIIKASVSLPSVLKIYEVLLADLLIGFALVMS